jgi:anti-sigma regulatory factor (Ser/Thr protein kinase)
MGYLKHNGKKYKSVLLKISRSTDFSRILDELHHLFFAGIDEKDLENIRYSLLELVNNSIRAHKEKQEDRDILLRFRLTENEIITTLKDWGGGFDKKKLPYDLEQEVHDIDINNQDFLDYRETHGYHRFGMGLFITKKTFTYFKLSFVGHQGEIQEEYEAENTAGTYIELRSKLQ